MFMRQLTALDFGSTLHLGTTNVIPSRSLTLYLKRMVSKRNFLLQGLIFRFHVKLQGCNPGGDCFWEGSRFNLYYIEIFKTFRNFLDRIGPNSLLWLTSELQPEPARLREKNGGFVRSPSQPGAQPLGGPRCNETPMAVVGRLRVVWCLLCLLPI